MRTMRWGAEAPERRGRPAWIRWAMVLFMVALAAARHGPTGWLPAEGLMERVLSSDLMVDLAQAAIWLAHRGLEKLGLPGVDVGRSCAPEA